MTSRRGINRDGFTFIECPEHTIDLTEEAMKSIFGERFIGAEATKRVWGEIEDIPPVPSDVLDMVSSSTRDVGVNSILYFDPGYSPRQLYERFGQESVDEQCETICRIEEVWNLEAEPEWYMISILGLHPRPKNVLRQTTYSFRSILYALQMFYLLTGESATSSYWMRTTLGDVALSHKGGLARATPISR